MNIPKVFKEYPAQLRLMFVGMLISTMGASMIWPFMMIYASSKLDLPLTAIASLLTIQAAAGLISTSLAGPVIDRLGRKWMMVFSLLTNGIVYLFLSHANDYQTFAILMTFSGAVNPIYRVGSDAMLADLIPEEKRVDGYALLRLSNNLGIALGPAIGGWLAATSYDLAFLGATIGMSTYSLLLAIFARETLPQKEQGITAKLEKETFGGYPEILRDRPFIRFIGAFILVSMCATLIWTLLGVYAKTNYQLSERQYGFLPTTNAFMVVTLQLWITSHTKRYPILPVLAVGAVLYALATGSIAFMISFWGFWLSMVTMTLGELVLVPTASTFVANLAPKDKRGRYMGIFGLTWSIAAGIAPIMGGLLNDNLGPRYIWLGGMIAGLLSAAAFAYLYKSASISKTASPSPAD